MLSMLFSVNTWLPERSPPTTPTGAAAPATLAALSSTELL